MKKTIFQNFFIKSFQNKITRDFATIFISSKLVNILPVNILR